MLVGGNLALERASKVISLSAPFNIPLTSAKQDKICENCGRSSGTWFQHWPMSCATAVFVCSGSSGLVPVLTRWMIASSGYSINTPKDARPDQWISNSHDVLVAYRDAPRLRVDENLVEDQAEAVDAADVSKTKSFQVCSPYLYTSAALLNFSLRRSSGAMKRYVPTALSPRLADPSYWDSPKFAIAARLVSVKKTLSLQKHAKL